VKQHAPTAETVPLFSAWASSSGPLTRACFDTLRERMVDGLRAERRGRGLDGVYLCLHGAMGVEGVRDPETQLLRAAREAAGEAPGPITELTLGQVERAVKLGLLAPDDLRTFAIERGYSAADADLLVELATFQVPDLREADRRREEIRQELATKRIALDDLERAVLRGIRTLEDFEAELAARGYGEDDTALLGQLLAERIAVDVAGMRTKISAALAKAEAAPALEELTGAVIAGALDPAEALAILEGAGVARDTALVYVRLVLTRGAEG